VSERAVNVSFVAEVLAYRRALTVASSAVARMTLDSATWEPHDWSTFKAGEG
jgi:hypothetical protein